MPATADREFVERVGQVRTPLSEAEIERLRPLLAVRSIPASLRVPAAARALASLPDTLASVRSIAKPLTHGVSPLRRLERLRHLQHQVETNRSLDTLIERREARLKMDCPRCGRRYPRETMVRHLWHEHGLLLEQGKVRSPRRTVGELKSEHAASRDTTVLDRTSLVADDAAIRAWVAASDPPEDDVAPLLAAAAEHGCGLCPACFAEREPALPPLPPPLTRSRDRLAGDGDIVQIHGRDWFPTLTVSTSTKFLHFGPEGSIGSRGLATLAAGFLLSIAFAITVFGSKEWAATSVIARFVMGAAVAYGLIRFLRVTPRQGEDRVVDAAWTHQVPKWLGGNRTARSLTRLCRSSMGRGDPAARAGLLTQTLDRAAEEDAGLLAAAAVLQASDRARMGHDHASAIAALIADALRGEHSTAFAEYAAECYLSAEPPPPAPERARIRVLALAAAFEAGFSPRNLSELWAVAPHLKRLMGVEPLHRIALLQGVWKMQPNRGWERIARAESVFELCRSAPNISGRLLADFPDLLLCHRPDPDTEAQLGPVLICTRGIVVGGRMLADPQTDVSLEKVGGRIELQFGTHRFTLERTPAGDLAEVIREWLRFRAWALLPLLDNYLLVRSSAIAARALQPFRSRCPHCGTVSAILSGEVGVKA
jgi:predicted RNA-binding Zn-ribbon protein involved in translation (DUF1610 family)